MTVVTKAEDAGGWSAYDTETCMTGAGATQREAIINLTDKLAAAGLYMLQQINPPAALTKARLEASLSYFALLAALKEAVAWMDDNDYSPDDAMLDRMRAVIAEAEQI